MGAGGAHAGRVRRGLDAALGDLQYVLGHLRDDALGEGQVNLEGREVAVVDPDHVRVVPERALELGLVMDLEKGVQTGELRRAVDRADLVVGQAADDDEDAAGASLGRPQYLERVHHEVLADAGQGSGALCLVVGHLDQVGETALEISRLGQHRQAVGARLGVEPGLGDGVDLGLDLAHARGGPFDLGDDGQAPRDIQGLTESRR